MSSQLPCLQPTRPHVYLLLKRTLFICYYVFTITLSSQSTRPHVYLLLKRTLFICYYVFYYSVFAINLFTGLPVHSSTKICSSVTMSFIYPVYSHVASCLNKGIYIYIIRRQKSVKFNYFSNLPICRK